MLFVETETVSKKLLEVGSDGVVRGKKRKLWGKPKTRKRKSVLEDNAKAQVEMDFALFLQNTEKATAVMQPL